MDKAAHKGHRRRVKERFLNGGLDGFSEHEVLEFLLFYSIPRMNVNEIAHRLVERFGSLRGVLEASYEELLTVDGVGENSATLIRLSAELSRRYLLSDTKVQKRFETLDRIGEYALKLYAGENVEKVYVLLFNGKMEMIKCVDLGEGTVNSAKVTPRKILEQAILNRATGIVITHNHPTGLPVPSGSDIEFNSQLEYLCSQMEVTLLEHIIVADGKYTPIMHRPKTDDGTGFKRY